MTSSTQKSFIVRTQSTWVRAVAGHEQTISRRDSQLLYGEPVCGDNDLYTHWLRATAPLDGYTGWVDMNDVRDAFPHATPTHVITTRTANLYPSPTFKSRPSLTLTFMAQVKADPSINVRGFIPVRDNTRTIWVPENHILAKNDLPANPVDILDSAKMFLGTPYLYGGRGHGGIDCSGLVQVSMQRNGVFCPRDTDQQENVIGEPVPVALKNLRRGDVVYFPGHVGIMVNRTHMINANVRFMQVVIEPVRDVMKACENTITAIRRIPQPGHAPGLKR